MTRQGPPNVLMVFAKAPIPGRVKTRLAEELGEVEAAEIYRELGLRTVRQLDGGSYRTVIYYDPPDSVDEMRDWLGTEDHEYLPQPEGDLGKRLIHAFEWGFSEGELVCVVGTDILGLDASLIERAFSLLSGSSGADAVLGPATDGGYYLLGLRQRAPGLFEGISWSTDRVLDESMKRAEDLGLSVKSLLPLADVDRAEDVPEEYRKR